MDILIFTAWRHAAPCNMLRDTVTSQKGMKALSRQVYGPVGGVPGMILRSGKWPVKKLSLAVMFL